MSNGPVVVPVAKKLAQAGAVQVAVSIHAKPDETWHMLTDQGEVGRWFGDLDHSLSPGKDARLDFGDADFFHIRGVEFQRPAQLKYKWRFLGTGPENAILWRIEPEGTGSLVTVTDEEPDRSAETVQELTDGWTDFLQRLERYSATGKITRYDWRRDFDGATEIPLGVEEAAEKLLNGRETDWLPFTGGPVAEGARLRLVDDAAGLTISAVKRAPTHVSFQLKKDDWLVPTQAEVGLEARSSETMLTVRHVRWDEISRDPTTCMAQRRLFGERWIGALHRAQQSAAVMAGAR
jgi:uncharacterized protein YndB with AHSA1/START domain